jgi:hypothetical protein
MAAWDTLSTVHNMSCIAFSNLLAAWLLLVDAVPIVVWLVTPQSCCQPSKYLAVCVPYVGLRLPCPAVLSFEHIRLGKAVPLLLNLHILRSAGNKDPAAARPDTAQKSCVDTPVLRDLSQGAYAWYEFSCIQCWRGFRLLLFVLGMRAGPSTIAVLMLLLLGLLHTLHSSKDTSHTRSINIPDATL